jgi:PQQ-like domain
VRSWSLALGVVLLVVGANARAQEVEPLDAWEGEAPNRGRPAQGPSGGPALSVRAPAGFEARVLGMLREREDDALAVLVQERLGNPLLRGVLVGIDPRRRHPEVFLGAGQHARRILQRLPPATRRAYQELWQADAAALLRPRPGSLGEAELRELVRRYPISAEAPRAASLLGDRCLERGEVAAASLWWRRALRLGPENELRRSLQARLLGLRAKTLGPAGREGWLTPARLHTTPVPRLRWARLAPGGPARIGRGPCRAAGADERWVYLAVPGGLLALDRSDGRLGWSATFSGEGLRVAAGGGQVVLLARDGLSAWTAIDGSLAWEVSLEDLVREPGPGDGFLDVIAAPDGWAVTATLRGERTLLGLSARGVTRWSTPLWAVRGDEERLVVVGDGRLASVGERVFLTLDGAVVGAESETGEVLWAATPWTCLTLCTGGRVFVDLAVDGYALEAVTAWGGLARLDPLDGGPLPCEVEDRGRLEPVSLLPLVALAGERLWRAGDPPLEGETLAAGELPIGPGARLGSILAVPRTSGLALVSLGSLAEPEAVDWPLAEPGQLACAGDLLLVLSPRGVACFGVGPGGDASEEPAQETIDDALRALDSPSWRRRLAAYELLVASDLPQVEASLAEAAEDGAASLELRFAASGLLDARRRERAWRELAAGAPADPPRAHLSEPGRLAALLPHLPPGEESARRLRVALGWLEEEPSRALAVEQVLLRDERLQGRVVRLVRRADGLSSRRAAADLLVLLVHAGGTTEALSRALEHPDEEVRDLVLLAALQGQLEERLGLDTDQATLERMARRWGPRPPQASSEDRLRVLLDLADRLALED